MAETKYLQLEHTLTKTELKEYGEKLAKEELSCLQTKQEKKEQAKEFQNVIDANEKEILRLSTAINTGTEFREMECKVDYHKDRGTKTIVVVETGESHEEPLTDDDYDFFN